jgi:hypothetical protein
MATIGCLPVRDFSSKRVRTALQLWDRFLEFNREKMKVNINTVDLFQSAKITVKTCMFNMACTFQRKNCQRSKILSHMSEVASHPDPRNRCYSCFRVRWLVETFTVFLIFMKKVPGTYTRTSNRGHWSLQLATEHVKIRGINCFRASQEHCIPYRTLKRRLEKNDAGKHSMGPQSN